MHGWRNTFTFQQVIVFKFWGNLQAKRGGLKDTLPDDMLLAVFKATLERTGINPAVSAALCT
jgi:hypothetical protein